MVKLTRIYTRAGDAGATRLGDNSVTSKNDLRLQTYADIDEANAWIGLVIAHDWIDPGAAEVLSWIQNDLFDVGADLSVPLTDDDPATALRVDQAYIERLERWCDSFNEELLPLRSFVLPGGTVPAAQLHIARTVVRRAERSGWAAREMHGSTVSKPALVYLNRLSDLFFVMARVLTKDRGDVLWEPGGGRQEPTSLPTGLG